MNEIYTLCDQVASAVQKHLVVHEHFFLQHLARRPEWTNMSNAEKLYNIIREFNYRSYGQQLLSLVLRAIQDWLPSNEVPMLRDFLVDLETLSTTKVLGVKNTFSVVST